MFCCDLTGRSWGVLACECVQGFRGQSCAAASNAQMCTPPDMSGQAESVRNNLAHVHLVIIKTCMCTDIQFGTLKQHVELLKLV